MSTFTAEKIETTMPTNEATGILKTDDLNIDNVIFTTPKLGKNKKLTAAIINSKTNNGIYLETSALVTVFAVNYYRQDQSKEIKDEDKQWAVLLKPSKNKDFAENTEKLYSYLRLLNKKAIEWGVENSISIFKKKLSQEVVEMKFSTGFKTNIGKDGTVYPEQIAIKLMKNNENFQPNVLIFKDSTQPMEINSWEELQSIIPANTIIQLIMQPQISFNSTGGYGINFKALQILILDSKKASRPTTYAFSSFPQNNKNEENTEEDEVKTNKFLKKEEESAEDSDKDSEVDIEDN